MNQPGPTKQDDLLHFGAFTLNISRRGLYRGQDRVRLTAKPLETLIFLVENRGRVVQKQEVLNAVWKGTFVTEDTLVHAIREIRRALEDDRDNPRFIFTVPREGYRFVCEVLSEVESDAGTVSTGSVVSTDKFNEPKPLIAPIPDKLADSVVSPRPRRWLVLSVLGLLVLLPTIWIATMITSRIRSIVGAQDTHPTPSPNLESQKLITTTEFSEGKPALSADGTLLLYVSTNPDDNEKTSDGKVRTFGDLFIKQLATGNHLQITHKENPSGDIPVFTADNSFLVFSSHPKDKSRSNLINLYKASSNGDREFERNADGTVSDEPVPYIRDASGAGFSPDEQWVAYTKHLPGRKPLWRSPANDPESDQKEIAKTGFTPRWSADGKWLAYTTSNPNGGVGDIWVVDASSFTSPRNVTNEPQQIYGLTWTPDDKFLIFASKRKGPSLLWRIPVEGGEPQAVTGLVGDFSAPSMSRQGNVLVFSYYRGTQNLMLADGLKSEARSLTSDEYHKFVRLSPSGQYEASVMEQPEYGAHLYVRDLLGGARTRLSNHPSHHPSWAAEGIVCYLHWDPLTEQTHVFQVNITNPNQPVTSPLTGPFHGKAEWLDINPANGMKMALVLTIDGKQQIIIHDSATKKTDLVTSGREYANVRWSRDGSMLAWSGPEETGEENGGVWIIKPGIEKDPRRIVTNGFEPVWNSDNSIIYFSRIGNQSGLFEFDLKSNKETPIREWREIPYFDVIGERLVYCQLGSMGKNRVYSLNIE